MIFKECSRANIPSISIKTTKEKRKVESLMYGDNNGRINYRGAGSPEATAPISVKRVSGSRVPLNSGRKAASV